LLNWSRSIYSKINAKKLQYNAKNYYSQNYRNCNKKRKRKLQRILPGLSSIWPSNLKIKTNLSIVYSVLASNIRILLCTKLWRYKQNYKMLPKLRTFLTNLMSLTIKTNNWKIGCFSQINTTRKSEIFMRNKINAPKISNK
jgi:hypothetical protein